MRLDRAAMERSLDNIGWATFATAVGMITGAHEITQYAIAMFTLGSGIVVSHFLKRYLSHRFPPKKREENKDAE